MSWLGRFLTSPPALSAGQAARLAAWQHLPAVDLHTPIAASRYVVVDVESSGLNIHKDRLIAIGAVAVVNGRVAIGDSIEIILQQDRVSTKDNILIHGIGGTAQQGGVPAAAGLLDFLEYLGKDPLVAFHAAFDEAMIKRALRQFLGLRFNHVWTDLAYVGPALYPSLAARNRSLDQWMAHFDISNYARHSALADALATAELMLALGARMKEKSVNNMRDLRSVEKKQRRMQNLAH